MIVCGIRLRAGRLGRSMIWLVVILTGMVAFRCMRGRMMSVRRMRRLHVRGLLRSICIVRVIGISGSRGLLSGRFSRLTLVRGVFVFDGA